MDSTMPRTRNSRSPALVLQAARRGPGLADRSGQRVRRQGGREAQNGAHSLTKELLVLTHTSPYQPSVHGEMSKNDASPPSRISRGGGRWVVPWLLTGLTLSRFREAHALNVPALAAPTVPIGVMMQVPVPQQRVSSMSGSQIPTRDRGKN